MSGLESAPNTKIEASGKEVFAIKENSLKTIDYIAKYIAQDRSGGTFPVSMPKLLNQIAFGIRGLDSEDENVQEKLHTFHYLLTALIDITVIDKMALNVDSGTYHDRYARASEDISKERGSTKIPLRQKDFFNDLNEGVLTRFAELQDDESDDDEQTVIGTVDDLSEDTELIVAELLKELSTLQDNRADRYYVRKMRAAAHTISDEEVVEQYEQQHRKHYENFFTSPEGKRPEVLLTNSGSRANESVIRGIAKFAPEGERLRAYYEHGWYYENINSIGDYYDISEPDEANVFFLNSESSYPIDDSVYQERLHKQIISLIERASKNQSEHFYLVIDATTDLLCMETLIDDLPENLNFIKTQSFTKHQRGGQNYFFGGIATWCQEGGGALQQALSDEVSALDAKLDTFETINFPRLRRSEVESNIQRNREMQDSFVSALDNAQSSIPERFRLRLHNYNYFTYIESPDAHFSDNYHIVIETIDEIAHTHPEIIIEDGDSFGLSATRICPINTRTEGKNFRISFGLESDPSELLEIGKMLGSVWSKHISNIIEARAQGVNDPCFDWLPTQCFNESFRSEATREHIQELEREMLGLNNQIFDELSELLPSLDELQASQASSVSEHKQKVACDRLYEATVNAADVVMQLSDLTKIDEADNPVSKALSFYWDLRHGSGPLGSSPTVRLLAVERALMMYVYRMCVYPLTRPIEARISQLTIARRDYEQVIKNAISSIKLNINASDKSHGDIDVQT